MRETLDLLLRMPPDLDEEQRRRAQLINLLTLTGLLAILVYALFIAFGPAARFPIRLAVTVGVVVLPVQLLLRLRFFRLSSIWLVSGVWLVYTISLYQLAGYQTTLVIFYMVVIYLGGILLGRPAGVVVAIASIGAVFAGAYLGAQGIIPAAAPPEFQSSAPSLYAFVAITILLGALLQLQANTSTSRALAREQEATRQVEMLASTLETRVDERTRDLLVAAEVGRTVTRVRNLDQLLTEAVQLIGDRFELYYTQIYLLDALNRNLVMRAGTGIVGTQLRERGHRLPLSMDSINGTAAVERSTVIVPDTRSSLIFRPNDLLPETRSEAAVPLIVGDRIVGVLNMQSDRVQGFVDESIPSFEALAGQLAVAIENASLFAETRQAQDALAAQARRLVSSGWREFLNGIDRPRRLGYVYDQVEVLAIDDAPTATVKMHSVPIAIAGQAIGAIQVESERWTEEEQEVVAFVARQVAQHIDNLRLLSETERYRAQAEETMRRVVRESWRERTGAAAADGFVYDGRRVLPLHSDRQRTVPPNVRAPLVVQGEEIGELGIVDTGRIDDDDQKLVSTIATRLSEHLANLRLSEQTSQALIQTEVLYLGGDRVVHAQSIGDVLEAVVEFTALKNFHFASIAFFDRPWSDTPPDTITVVTSWAATGALPDMYKPGASYPAADWEQVLQSNLPTILADVKEGRDVPRPIHDLVWGQMGMRSLVMFPLVAGGVWYGILTGQSVVPRTLSESELRQLNSLTDQAASVVQGIRLLSVAQRRAEQERRVREITDRVRRESGQERILDVAREQIGALLRARGAHAALGNREQLLSRLAPDTNGAADNGQGTSVDENGPSSPGGETA